MMDVVCDCCGMCCKLIPVKNGDSVLVRDGFQLIEEDFQSFLCEISEYTARSINEDYVEKVKSIFSDIKFYSCKNLSADNKCLSDKKPFFCERFPSSALAIVPDGCWYAGEIFIKNEQLKRKIRMIKEEILDYTTVIENKDKDSESYKKIIENLNRFITKYKDFGSENW